MQKPTVLYHASDNTELEIIEPRAISKRDESEGKVVFATPDGDFAACFIVRTDDSWTASGFANSEPFILISDKERFIKADNGGAIYTVPSNTFSYDIHKGIGKNEWASMSPVQPISKQVYESGLGAMIECGVKVYFTDQVGLIEFRESDKKHEYLKKIKSQK